VNDVVTVAVHQAQVVEGVVAVVGLLGSRRRGAVVCLDVYKVIREATHAECFLRRGTFDVDVGLLIKQDLRVEAQIAPRISVIAEHACCAQHVGGSGREWWGERGRARRARLRGDAGFFGADGIVPESDGVSYLVE
jgi:hypothetical protein